MKSKGRAVLGILWMAGFLVATGYCFGQSKGVPIEREGSGVNKALLDRAEILRKGGQLLDGQAVGLLLKEPSPERVELTGILRQVLPGREVARRARAASLHVGWYYLCPNCNNWHLKLSGGYAVARDVIVTCHHCVDPSQLVMREGYLVVVDSAGQICPVRRVLARSAQMDAAVLRVSEGDFLPMALNDDVAPGDAVYCFSDPLGQKGYFSQGIVNRFVWLHGKKGLPESAEELSYLRVNVSTEWAPGSSGAAILDACGNVIGHVATIAPMTEKGRLVPPAEQEKTSDPTLVPGSALSFGSSVSPQNPIVRAPDCLPTASPSADLDATKTVPSPQVPSDRFNGAVLITLHSATPAKGVLALIREMNQKCVSKSE